jgi:folylpolyglutamate synthase/dihydropteroate synthase
VTKAVVTTAVASPRAVPAVDLAEKVARMMPDVRVLASESVEIGLDMARAEAGPHGAVLVTGSLYLVGRVRDLLG